MHAQVAFDLPLDRAFDYLVPEGMALAPGQRVLAPFGRRHLQGVAVSLNEPERRQGIKALERVLDPAPVASPAMLEFTRWLADYYLCGWGEALALALPPQHSARQQAFIAAPGREALLAAAAGLAARQARSRAALLELAESGLAALSDLQAQGLSPLLLKRGLAEGWLKRQSRPVAAAAGQGGALALASVPPQLTPAQAAAVLAVGGALKAGQGGGFLLHGVTGSGKTEVYLHALAQALGQGGSAIALVPEISLTPQTLARFNGRFPGLVAVLHSGLSAAERAENWRLLASGQRRVALGPRSALFAPLKGLRLIVVDEESEPSYKQENPPRYHARDAALVRGRLERAVVLLGSATPSFESWANARAGKLSLLSLPGRVGASGMPSTRLLDLGQRKDASAPLLPALEAELEARLKSGEQSLLFLNRRGFAPALVCVKCGSALQCPHCSIALTFHKHSPAGGADARGWLLCHLCGHGRRPPQACPEPKCGGLLRVQGTGTQRLEEELARRFPRARIRRVDRDTAQARGFHQSLGEAMHAGDVDVLVGTQMIAKGLDFPNLTLVGVVNADASLNFPDFRAAERTFQLLVQVAGRAGRADKPGLVLVQTLRPEHPCLLAAAKQDFAAFFEEEHLERKALGYPPYGRLAALLLRSRDKAKAQAAADSLGQALQALAQSLQEPGLEVMGPAPSPLVEVKGWWRYRLLIKCPSHQGLHRLLKQGLAAWQAPHGASLAVDVDPMSFL
jgi:primosomal protein N' (replication factor Y)